jgi:hypothetical protein
MNATTKYFLYARKSTKDHEKQVLSIPSQLDVLRKLAKQQNLIVAAEITEKESAHTPGRPEFNKMMQRIAEGEANGIIATSFHFQQSGAPREPDSASRLSPSRTSALAASPGA